MACIKCGKKLKNHNVFCEECLAEAAYYPVEPNTPITLPRRTDVAQAKKRNGRKRPALSPEEQVPRLRKSLRRLTFFLVVLFLLLSACLCIIWDLLREESHVRRALPALCSAQADENVSRETFSELVF